MPPLTGLIADAVLTLCGSVDSNPDTVNHAEVMLYRHCREGRGSRDALYFDGEIHNYQKVADAASHCTQWLRSLGVRSGDRVILMMPDCPTLVAAYFGVVAVGAVAIILDPALPSEDAFYVAQHCQARLTIACDKLVDRVQGLRAVGGMMAVVGAGASWTRPSEFAAAIAHQSAPEYMVHGGSSRYAYGLLSSGSTGRPKLIVHRHQDIFHGYFAFGQDVAGLHAGDRVICVAKMTTGYGLGCSVLMPFLCGASVALVSEPPGAAVTTGVIEAYRCTLLFAQPRFLAEVAAGPDWAGRLKTLRLAFTGGEPLSGALLDRWNQVSQAELLDSYGSTEVGFLYISNRVGEARRGSVGRPVDGLNVEITDHRGKAVRAGEIGKLRVRGPMVIDSYWNDPVRSEQSFQDGWFTTSDMFSLDRDGFYYIHGRSDHLIKLGCGDWVNPTELEMVLLEHPRVRECAVVGTPGETGLTVLKATVVPQAPGIAEQGLASELSDLVREHWPMQTYKHLDIIEFSDALPKTIAGKLDRAKLRPQSMTEFSYRC